MNLAIRLREQPYDEEPSLRFHPIGWMIVKALADLELEHHRRSQDGRGRDHLLIPAA